MDLPLFGDAPNKRRREINLGGARGTTASYDDILQQAKQRRLERNDKKRRADAATRIQASWRRYAALRDVRRSLRHTFDEDVTTLTALRSLVLLGQDEDALAKWSSTIVSSKPTVLAQSDPSSLVLLQRIARMLLVSLSHHFHSSHSQTHVAVLNALLSANPKRRAISRYLISNGFYLLLRDTLLQLPVPAKNPPPPSLSPLATLITLPCSDPELLPLSLREFVLHILTVPLLPNRLLRVLAPFSARLPLTSIDRLPLDIVDDPALSSVESKLHLLANLVAFMPPRYSTLSSPVLVAYLQLCSALMNALPTLSTDTLEPTKKDAQAQNVVAHDDEDSEDEGQTLVEVVSSFEPKPKKPVLDERTQARLLTFPSPTHIDSLVKLSRDSKVLPAIVAFSVAIIMTWTTRREKVLGALLARKDALFRELFRAYVRSSPLGRDADYAEITKSDHASHWPPLLLLAEMYTQMLLTMTDDEFFSSGTNPDAPRNPLTLDEVTLLTRKLLNIAFALYWRDDPTSAQEPVPGLGKVKWEIVRDIATRCLIAVHARDSRRPFTPPNHWLTSFPLDMNTFIQAAITEEKQLIDAAHMGEDEGRPIRRPNKRELAHLSPRLGVLNNIPFAIPFDVRVGIFRRFVINDMEQRGLMSWRGRMQRTEVVIRRDHIAQDGFDKLGELDLKAPIAITFIDQFGEQEQGIDGGGVFKEFLTSLSREVFHTDRGLWMENQNHELYPASHSLAMEPHSLAWYKFIGRILGKALYEGILVDVAFAGFFLAKWLGKQSFLDDLASLDPEFYHNLIYLKHQDLRKLETDGKGGLGLDFTILLDDFGRNETVELIPGGSEIPVTEENKLQYIYLVAHYKLTKQIKKQSAAFFEGLSDMIEPRWLRMFNQQELQILLGGVNTPIDLDDLRKHTNYGGLYDDHHPVIQMFWEVVNTFTQEERQKLLAFATSCSRPPLLGFKELNPNFCIRDSSDDQERLPSSSTCVNLLKLPRYKSAQVMREKLLHAINAKAGFYMS